jgi:hypothetical protein
MRSRLRSGHYNLVSSKGPDLALKRLAVAPAEGLLTEPVLKHAALHQTAARDPKLSSLSST